MAGCSLQNAKIFKSACSDPVCYTEGYQVAPPNVIAKANFMELQECLQKCIMMYGYIIGVNALELKTLVAALDQTCICYTMTSINKSGYNCMSYLTK